MFEIYVGMKLIELGMYLLGILGITALIGLSALIKSIGNKMQKELTNENKDGKLK